MGLLVRPAETDFVFWVAAATKGRALSTGRRQHPNCLPSDEELPSSSALRKADSFLGSANPHASDKKILQCTNPLPCVPVSSPRCQRAGLSPCRRLADPQELPIGKPWSDG